MLCFLFKYLHNEKKLLHGDIKSCNVVIKGDFETVKICDVGVSLQLDENMTGNDCLLGFSNWHQARSSDMKIHNYSTKNTQPNRLEHILLLSRCIIWFWDILNTMKVHNIIIYIIISRLCETSSVNVYLPKVACIYCLSASYLLSYQ